MTPQEIIHSIKNDTAAARIQARVFEADGGDPRLLTMVFPLADALDSACDLLIQQQRALNELRHWKADA